MNRAAVSLPNARPRAALRPLAERLTAIIDIGSNSVRLVVYRGVVRVPLTVFNEKVMCGLAKGLAETGRMDEDTMEQAIDTLRRFALLCADMQVDQLTVVATAAVRLARNGPDFVARVKRETGLDITVITGEQEGYYAALGVLSGMPWADGVVGDLGGGSLELIRISGGKVGERVSLPIGVLTLRAQAEAHGARGLQEMVARALETVPWLEDVRGLPFYTVGGSWRALAHLDMHLNNCPLRIIQSYQMEPAALGRLGKALATLDRKELKKVKSLTERRLPSLPVAVTVLEALVKALDIPLIINSAYGLREGLLFDSLPPAIKREDPLLAACRVEARHEGRFPEHGDALMVWMDPLFSEGESHEDRRLRLAACLLADVAWRGHPDFRAERALEASFYGNWVGIDFRGRAMVGAALYACYGASISERYGPIVQPLASAEDLSRARAWGLALRLGQRLTAGTAKPLEGSRLFRRGDQLVLALTEEHTGLYGEVVDRRLASLAKHLGLTPRFELIRNH
ncbi:Ppx/GppA phosphatase family protein [Pedomonas sp. V897]|uniref:Ppx/GppA phosphatase family protein n=1 Tax=Pedomonas sp. V897 TaxID=3446482 RepID=UPI003EE40607